MKVGEFELLSVEDLRRKYGLVAANPPRIVIRAERVPEGLRHLIPHAELWGVEDDLIREDMVRHAPPAALRELRTLIKANEHVLEDWLAGPEASNPDPSPEYCAFSAMRMAADLA
jgi:hypothetical protein